MQNPRYGAAFDHADNPEAFAKAVAAAGFATDPGYGAKLVQIMRDNDLEQFDRV
jgi:flagellum-specific peptidoglycan hydrolase FlgJ